MKVKYDLYKSPPQQVDGKEVTYLHARVADFRTVSINDLGECIQRSTSLTRTDLMAVLSEVADRFLEELQQGNRVYLEGIGYFQMTLDCPSNIQSRGEVRAESIRFRSVAYTPEKKLVKRLRNTKFIRSERSGHTLDYSESELTGILTDYFKDHGYITRRELEHVCAMTRSTAYRRLKAWIAENKLSKIVGIDAYSPVPGNFGISGD